MKRNCELCKNKAAIYCDSDQASLCWTCDAKVHSANFLVARHSRCLLCHVCQSLTSWTATGSKLGPTLSVCEGCLGGEEEDESNGGEIDESDDDDDDDDGGGVEEEEENQVVPWSTTSASPPPAASSSSSSEESTNGQPEVSRKRARENALDHWYNGDSGDVSRENDLTPPMLTEETAEAGGSGGAEDETALDDSSSTSMIRRRMRSLKARRIETGRKDRAEGDTTK